MEFILRIAGTTIWELNAAIERSTLNPILDILIFILSVVILVVLVVMVFGESKGKGGDSNDS